ncbi:MAG: ATP-binding protein [bacterium]
MKYLSIKHISTKLIVLLIISVLAPLLIYGVISIRTARVACLQSVSEGNTNVAIGTAEQLELYLENTINILRGLADNINRIYLTTWQKEVIIRNVVISFDEFRKIDIIDRTGLQTATSSLDEGSFDRANEEPFKTAIQGKTYFSEVFISDRLVPSIIIALPIQGASDIDGVMVGEVDLSAMWSLVDSIKIGEKGFAFVVSKSGLLIAQGDNEHKPDLFKQKNLYDLDIVKSVLEGKTTTMIYKNEEGIKVLGVGHPVTLSGWGVIIEQPAGEAFMVASRMTLNLSILIAFFLAIIIIIGTIGGRQLVKPIYELIEATRAISSGDLTKKVTVSSLDEFEELGNSFNMMTEKLLKLKEEIRITERFSIFARIAAGLVHDLKHPIKNIENSSNLILRLYKDQEYREVFHKTVKREFRNINRFLNDLHNLTHPTPIAPIALNVEDVLNTIINLYKEEAGRKGIEVKLMATGCDCRALRIVADKFLFERIIKNLITNAIEAMPEGGLLSIALTINNLERSASIAIEDTGIGIPKERVETIFTDYITTKRKGIGLGLAITKKNVLELKGSITVESEVDKGSIFTVTFPLAPNR